MVFRKKNEEEEKKELTMQEAIVTMGKTIANINSRLDKQEQKPQEQHKEVEQPVQQQVKKAVERFVVYDQPIEHKRHILDNTDPENPVVYDIETALVKILNDIEYLKKALG